jgi:hypothetical protein
LAEGNYNVTSLQPQCDEEPLQQIHDVEDDAHIEELHDVEAETHGYEGEERSAEQEPLQEIAAASAERRCPQKTAATRKKPIKEERPRKKIETMMGKFLEMREKQAENEAAEMARERESREKEAAEGDKYSIRRCVSVINTMELTKGEKAKAIAVIAKSKDSREAFLCTFEVDQECALIWLKNEMA